MDPDVNSRAIVTIVLPHRERFSPASAGAVALVVRSHAASGSKYRSRVIGPPVAGEGFAGVDFLPARAPRWLPLSGSQRYIVALVQLLRRLPPGLIEVHNKPEVALWLARCFPRRPVSLFLHNDPRTMRGAVSPGARRQLLRRLSQVVTVSNVVRQWFLEGLDLPPGGPAPVVLHNALDPGALPPALPAGERERVILFAGRVVPDKAPDAFIAACARALPKLPGWRATMIGTDGFSADLPDSRFILGLRPQAAAAGVQMLGYRPHGDVLTALSRAAIAVVPSRWAEPFGLAALEAMACGAALVCSMRGGLAEVVGEAGMAVDPDDVADIAAVLVKLARDDGFRASLAAAGRARATGSFALGKTIKELDTIRSRIMSQRAIPIRSGSGQCGQP